MYEGNSSENNLIYYITALLLNSQLTAFTCKKTSDTVGYQAKTQRTLIFGYLI